MTARLGPFPRLCSNSRKSGGWWLKNSSLSLDLSQQHLYARSLLRWPWLDTSTIGEQIPTSQSTCPKSRSSRRAWPKCVAHRHRWSFHRLLPRNDRRAFEPTDGVLHWRRRGPVGLTDGEMTDASAGDMTKPIDTNQCAIHRNATTNLVKTKKTA
jgi:hypothetical protein